jgi:predicted nucleic acid-binding Zn finger protein
MANYYVVESSNARYLVNGSCNCPDATNRVELTKGLCKHRLAAMVYAEQQGKAETSKATTESPQADDDVNFLSNDDPEFAQKINDLFR